MKIPHQVIGRTNPSGRNLRYLRTNASAEDFGAAIGRGLQNFGGAISRFEEQYKNRIDESNRFNRQRAAAQFQTRLMQESAQRRDNLEGSGAGFMAMSIPEYERIREQFVEEQGIAPEEVDAFMAQTESILQAQARNDLAFELDYSDNYYQSEIQTEFTAAQNRVFEDPSRTDAELASLAELIESSSLSTQQKADTLRRARIDLLAVEYGSRVRNGELAPSAIGMGEPQVADLEYLAQRANSSVNVTDLDPRSAAEATQYLRMVAPPHVRLTSGYRGAGHPVEQRKRRPGQGPHTVHGAMDFSGFRSEDEKQAAIDYWLARGARGIGWYSWGIHVDFRPNPSGWGPNTRDLEGTPQWFRTRVAQLKAGQYDNVEPAIPNTPFAIPRPTSGPRGIRNHNPGNIKDGDFAQGLPGYTGSDGTFAQFNSPQAGAYAMARLLRSYENDGLNTIASIIGRWAPPQENATQEYIRIVSEKVGIDADQPFSFTGNPGVAVAVMKAMMEHENGVAAPLSDGELVQVHQALVRGEGPPVPAQSAAQITDPRYADLPLEMRQTLFDDAMQARNDLISQMAAAREAQREMAIQQLQTDLFDGRAGKTQIEQAREALSLTYDETNKAYKILNDRNNEAATLRRAVDDLRSPNKVWDANSEREREKLDALFKQAGGAAGIKSRDETTTRRLFGITSTTGVVPPAAIQALGELTFSEDPAVLDYAFGTLNMLREVSPYSFNLIAGEDLVERLSRWRSLSQFMDQTQLRDVMKMTTDPLQAGRMRQVEQQASELFDEEYEAGAVWDKVASDLNVGFPLGRRNYPNNPVSRELHRDFRTLFIQGYKFTGTQEGAERYAREAIKNKWGKTTIGTRERMMPYPPDSNTSTTTMIPPIDGSHGWIKDQLLELAREEIDPDIEDGQITLVFDDVSERNRRLGKIDYAVVITDPDSGVPRRAVLPPVTLDDGTVQPAQELRWPYYNLETGENESWLTAKEGYAKRLAEEVD